MERCISQVSGAGCIMCVYTVDMLCGVGIPELTVLPDLSLKMAGEGVKCILCPVYTALRLKSGVGT